MIWVVKSLDYCNIPPLFKYDIIRLRSSSPFLQQVNNSFKKNKMVSNHIKPPPGLWWSFMSSVINKKLWHIISPVIFLKIQPPAAEILPRGKSAWFWIDFPRKVTGDSRSSNLKTRTNRNLLHILMIKYAHELNIRQTDVETKPLTEFTTKSWKKVHAGSYFRPSHCQNNRTSQYQNWEDVFFVTLNDTQDLLLVQAPATPCTTSTVEGVGNGGVWPFTLRASKPRMAQARRRTGRPAVNLKGTEKRHPHKENVLIASTLTISLVILKDDYFGNNKLLYIASKSLENEWRWWRLKSDSLHKNENKRWFTHCEPGF